MRTDDHNPHVNSDPASLYVYHEASDEMEVSVRPEFLPKHSRPDQGVFAWSYHITITNTGTRRIQLLRRHWIITNGHGVREEVIGDGVIGEQPIILPGQSYSYASGCPLRTPTGNMRGWYDCVDLDTRDKVRAKIPLFFLRAPATLH